jgi:hypothetical protein
VTDQHLILDLRAKQLGHIPSPGSGNSRIRRPIHSESIRRTGDATRRLDLQTLDLVLEGADLAHEVRGLVGGDGRGDDGAGDTAGTAKSHLGGDVDVGHVLVLAQEGQVEEDGQGGGVGGEDDDLGDTTVEAVGAWVSGLCCCGVWEENGSARTSWWPRWHPSSAGGSGLPAGRDRGSPG